MIKILKFNEFWFLFATLSILFSFTIFSNWVGMVFIWFGLFFTFRFTNLESTLSAKEHQLYLSTVLVYPLVETWIKWMVEKNALPDSWFWLNRLEHFCWAMALVIIFLPIFSDIWNRLSWWQNLLFVVSFACLLGNLNEFLEYFIRLLLNKKNQSQLAVYYWDTIYDMMMNIVGGFGGFVAMRLNTKLP